MITAKSAAYVIIGIGCVLSLATAFVPHAPGAYKLSYTLFLWGVTPYFIYLLVTESLVGYRLLTPGLLMLVLDACVRLSVHTSAQQTAGVYLPLVLILIALPVGVGLGVFFSRRFENSTDQATDTDHL